MHTTPTEITSPIATDQLLRDAVQFHRNGNLQDAEDLYRQIIANDPCNADARHNLGTLLVAKREFDEGFQLLRSALEICPQNANLWMSLAESLFVSGRRNQAHQVLEEAIQRGLAGSRVEQLLSQLNLQAPNPEERDAASQLFESGRLADAELAARDLVRRFPDHFHGWLVLATTLHAQGRSEEAFAAIERAYEHAPHNIAVLNTRGVLQIVNGHIGDAESSLLAAVRLRPSYDKAHSNLGVVYLHTGRFREAETAFRRATDLAPESAEAHNNHGVVLRNLGRFHEAELELQSAIRLKPNHADAWNNLGVVYRETGRLTEAELAYRNVLALQPTNWSAYSNLLFAKKFSTQESPAAYLQEARIFGAKLSQTVKKRFDVWRVEPTARLRIGFVSGDLRDHAVSYFLEGLLRCLNRDRFELYSYPTNALTDQDTTRFRSYFAGWRPIYGLGDDSAAQRIYEDGIHILFDLSGHTAHNRLPVFARKPAPVQVSWLGYFATTGVTEIDYLLADPTSVPANHLDHFSEAVWLLPDTRLCFTPPIDAPDVAPLPALTTKRITFGTFQNITKISTEVLKVWARIIRSLPGSRLRVQCRQLVDPTVRHLLRQRVESSGISLTSVDLLPPVPRQQYLAAHAEIDMILDTFPFPGGTTTCEALWMGVPTLTLRGDSMIGLQGASLLAAADMADWIANDEEQFVEKAHHFASNLPTLAILRSNLRPRLGNSPLFDTPRFTHAFESALERISNKSKLFKNIL